MTRPVVIHRDALLAFDDRARLILERIVAGEGPILTAGWLMCNPSDADAFIDDPTVGRVMHHSARVGCRRSLVGNVWSLRTPYPVELWSRLAQGEYTDTMRAANLGMLASIGAQADVLFVAFGAEPWRRHRAAVMEAIGALRSAPLTLPCSVSGRGRMDHLCTLSPGASLPYGTIVRWWGGLPTGKFLNLKSL